MSLVARWRRVWGAESERDHVSRGLEEAAVRIREVSVPKAMRAAWARRAEGIAQAKVALARSTGSPDCCRGCERNVSGEAAAPFRGGVCCGGTTSDLFSDSELVLLSLAGKSPARAPALTLQRGCAYRSVGGCVLAPDTRPVLCLEYACSELRAELASKGTLLGVVERAEALRVEADALVAEVAAASEA